MSVATNTQDSWSFTEGQEVRGADGEKVGRIVTVSARHIQVEHGFIVKHDYSVPKSAVHSIRDGVVFLGVPAGAVERAGWETEPGMVGDRS
jgi:hypothetical protein